MSVDLTTRYLGLELKNPLVASAGPLTGDLETLRQLEEAGVAAAVLPSLWQEQIEHEEQELFRLQAHGAESFAESIDYFPDMEDFNTGPSGYLRHIESAKTATRIPIIASLNGSRDDAWVHYAQLIEQAGADALELNIYFIPTDRRMSGEDVEMRYADLVARVRQSIKIPLAVKIGPYFSSLPHFAARLVAAGANGLVLFNRFLEPDIDLETLSIKPDLVLSQRYEIRLSLRWIAILRDQIAGSLAATSGVHTAEEALKLLLAGADVTMMTATLLRRGPRHVEKMLADMRAWLELKEYESVKQLRGSMSRRNCPDPSALERANYMKALVSFTNKDM